MLVANYFGGSVAVLPILSDGRLGNATDIKNDAGKIGPTRATNARQNRVCLFMVLGSHFSWFFAVFRGVVQ